MTKSRVILKEYSTINVSFDGNHDLPVSALRYLFMQITSHWNMGYKTNKKVEISKNPRVLNFIIINEIEKYEYYTSYEKLMEPEAQSLFILMLSDENSMGVFSSLEKADALLVQPLAALNIEDTLLKRIEDKKERIEDYLDHYRAQFEIENHNYEEAFHILTGIRNRGRNYPRTLCLISEVYDATGRHEDAIKVIHSALVDNPENYFLLRAMYFLLVKSKAYEPSFNILMRLFNMFPVDGKVLKTAVSNALEHHQFQDIVPILDYYYAQNEFYRNKHKRCIQVSLFIYTKHLILSNRPKLLRYYLKKLMKEVNDIDPFYRLVDASHEHNNICIDVLLECFKNSPEHLNTFLYADILAHKEKMSKGQLINRAKELIDLEKIKLPKIYKLLLHALKDIGNQKEYNSYLNEFEKLQI